MNLLLLLMTCTLMAAMVTARTPRVIDLTHELSPDFPVYPFYPHFNFTISVREQFPDYWLEYNYIGLVEHTGTHMDAPSHLRNAKGGNRMHQVPVERFIGPGVVIKVAAKARVNPLYEVSVDDIYEWEARHGLIPQGAIVMMDSGWTHKTHDAKLFFGTETPDDPTTFRSPGFSVAAADLLAIRKVNIVGSDTISADPGDSKTYPAHRALHPLDIMIVENIANLDQVPEAGTRMYCMPLNIHDGSGSPIRAFAIIDDDITLNVSFTTRCASLFYLVLLGVITVTLYNMLLLC